MKRSLQNFIGILFAKRVLLLLILFVCSLGNVNAQSPTFFSSGNYANPNNWAQGSAVAMGTIVGTNIHTTTPNGTGNQYFRFYSATSGGTTYEPNGGADILLTSGAAPISLEVTGSGKAYYLNIANAASNVVFKTNGSGTPGTSKVFAVEVQGTIRTVSAVTQSPTVANGINAGQNVTVTATLSGALATGQAVYLRYADLTSSSYGAGGVVLAMSGAGTTYTATIPAAANIASHNLSYYVFTSGATTPANADADLSTININNNGGSNYSYTVGASTTTYTYQSAATGVWNVGATWVGGVVPPLAAATQILTGHNVTINNTLLSGGGSTQTGKVLVDVGGTLTMAPGGTTFVNFTYGSNAVNAANVINGDYVQTSGTLAGNNGAFTFNGNVTLTAGVWNNQEYYGSGSTLIFNGLSPTTSNIWNSGGSAVYPAIASPYNVKINATTTLPTISSPYTVYGTLNIVAGVQLNTTNANLVAGELIGAGTYVNNGNFGLTVGSLNTSTTFSGAYNSGAVNTFTKVGTGTLTLSGSSNWNGPTAIQNGAVSVATLNTQIGSGTSNLGTPSSTAGNGTISLGSTTTTGGVIFTGGTVSSNRIINLAGTTGGGYIQADGTGPLTLSGTNTATGAGSKTLTLQGSNTGNNTISGAIVNNSSTNKTSLTKSGTGTWILSGTNTYTGTTTVSSGILQLGSTGAIANGASSTAWSDVVLAGGTLANYTSGTPAGFTIGSTSNTMGTLTLSSSSTIALGSGVKSLFFAPSSGTTWSGTLTITGWTGTAGSSGTAGKIFIGAATGTLTSAQLAQVTFSGFSAGAILLSTGELVPLATVFTTYYWIGGTTATTWQTASAWSLTSGGAAVGAVTVGAGSIFIFDGNNIITGGGTGNITVTNSTAAIDVAQVILQNSANVTYTPSSNGYNVTIQGTTGTDFSIGTGSTFSFGAKNYTITLAAGATGSIDGNVNIGIAGAQTHQLIGTSANSVTFNSGSVCTLNTSSGVIPFGSGTTNSIIFDAGARLIGIKNGDPFGGTGFTVLKFNPGSIYEYQGSSNTYMPFALSTTARVYAIFEISIGGLSTTSTQDVTVDTLRITSAAGSSSSIIFPGGGNLNIKGNLDNYSTKAFSLIGNSTSTIFNINFNGTGNQYIISRASAIGSGGGLIFGESSSGYLTNINFNNGATVFLGNGVDIADCQLISSLSAPSKTNMTVYSGTILDMMTSVVYGKDATHGGTFITQSSSTLKMGSTGGIALAGASTGNVQTQVRTFNTAGNYEYNGVTSPQVTGTALPATVNDLTINNSASSGIVQFTNTAGTQINGILYLKAATLDINAKTITMKGNGTTNSITVTGARSITNSSTTEGLIDVPTTATNLTITSSSGTSLSVGTKVELRTAKGVDFTNNFTTLNDTFRIKSGGYVPTTGYAPIYSTTSTLIYDCGCSYTSINSATKEWYENTTGTGAGVPQDVILKAGTSLNFSNTGFVHEMRGNLIIGEILGSASTLTLSSASGGDFNIGGNWTRNQQGAFVHNDRRVTFNGATGNQVITVTGSGTEAFGYISVNKSGGGNAQLAGSPNATNVSSAEASGNVLRLINGGLDINGNTFTLSGTGGNIDVVNGVRTITGAANSILAISGATGSISKTVISTSGGSLVTDVNVKVLLTTGIDFGNTLTTINGTLEMGANAYVNPSTASAPYYGTTSTLIYNGGTNFTSINSATKEWYENTYGTNAGVPNNVVIKAGTSLNFSNTNYPHEMQGSLTIGEATGSTSTLTLSTATGGNLNVGGSWTRNAQGIFVQNTRMVTFNGSNDAILTANGGELFYDMTLNKSTTAKKLTLADNVSISDSVVFTKGTLDLSANNKFMTILSTATKTASVGQSSSANAAFNYGSGNAGQFIIQRYVPAKRAWRLMSPPLKNGGTHTISQAWQEGQAFDYASTGFQASDTLSAGFATQITGGSTANGFDLSQQNKPSIFKFAPANTSVFTASGTWATLGNTNSTSINSERGWMLFVRGDRKNYGQITTAFKTPTITTLRPRGQINIGDVTIPTSGSLTGIQIVGNPYASAVDFNTISLSGTAVGTKYWVWDPQLGGSNGVGAFVALTWNGTNYTRSVPVTGTGTSTYDNRYIPSGAAVMVDFGTSGAITFKESDKNAANTTTAFRPVRGISTVLNSVEPDGSTFITDGVVNLFDEKYDTAVNSDDVIKLTNIEGENFSTKRNGVLLSIEKTKLPVTTDTIFYNWSKVKVREYQLEISTDSLQNSWVDIYLEDMSKKTFTPISLIDTTRYNFKIVREDSSTFKADRLRLVMKYNPPVITSLQAWQQYSDVKIKWSLQNERGVTAFIIERSSDGINFTEIGRVQATGHLDKTNYDWIDNAPMTGNNFYRIKGLGEDNRNLLSDIARVLIANPEISVYPNPVTNGEVGIQLTNMPKGIYGISLTNSLGQVIIKKEIKHLGGNESLKIPLTTVKIRGTYQLQVIHPDNSRSVIKIIY